MTVMEGWPVNATFSSCVCFVPFSGLLSLFLLFFFDFWFPSSSTSLLLSLSMGPFVYAAAAAF
jgi:hypothetical protein